MVLGLSDELMELLTAGLGATDDDDVEPSDEEDDDCNIDLSVSEGESGALSKLNSTTLLRLGL